MAKATAKTVYDGQTYEVGEEIPDLGSLECTDVVGNKRSYFGFQEDEDKLPTYDNLGGGSDATLVDPSGTNATKILYYHTKSKAWYPL